MIISDEDYAVMKSKLKDNKRIIKDAGFHVSVVKRQYRLLDSKSNRLAERATLFCQFDTFQEFADIVKKTIAGKI